MELSGFEPIIAPSWLPSALPTPSSPLRAFLASFCALRTSFPSLAASKPPLSLEFRASLTRDDAKLSEGRWGDDADCSTAPSAAVSPLRLSPAASYPFLRPCFLFLAFPPPLLLLFVPRAPLSPHFLGDFYFLGDFTPKK